MQNSLTCAVGSTIMASQPDSMSGTSYNLPETTSIPDTDSIGFTY